MPSLMIKQIDVASYDSESAFNYPLTYEVAVSLPALLTASSKTY